jgi:DNA-binding phage protein
MDEKEKERIMQERAKAMFDDMDSEELQSEHEAIKDYVTDIIHTNFGGGSGSEKVIHQLLIAIENVYGK